MCDYSQITVMVMNETKANPGFSYKRIIFSYKVQKARALYKLFDIMCSKGNTEHVDNIHVEYWNLAW